MTVFGNRDSGNGASSALAALPETVGQNAIATSVRPFGAVDMRRIVLRVHGDENIVVGSAEGREGAVRLAREMVQHIELAATNGEWPQIDERFIRPGAIVSVDVQRAD
jgi:hypothetical protein